MASADLLSVQYSKIRECLRRRLDLVADRAFFERDPKGHLEALKTVSEDLNTLARELPPESDPQLRHFLGRASYVKALHWLDSLS